MKLANSSQCPGGCVFYQRMIVVQRTDQHRHGCLNGTGENFGFWAIEYLTKGHDTSFTPPPFPVQDISFDKGEDVPHYRITDGLCYQTQAYCPGSTNIPGILISMFILFYQC
mmetsp:Transcript_1187/g.3534  ORF Transcript_1187/g.3534 Transcript_1187/m.3534 type:complete len:112 (+) Transcript_1187:1483-1818(+)